MIVSAFHSIVLLPHILIRVQAWLNFCQQSTPRHEGEPDPDIYETRFYAPKFFLEIATFYRLLLAVLVSLYNDFLQEVLSPMAET